MAVSQVQGCVGDSTAEETMTDTPSERPRYVLADESDVDLDAEDLRRSDGSRLTERAAAELAEEALALVRRGPAGGRSRSRP